MTRLILLLLFLCCVSSAFAASPSKRPNVLILMTDQHHADWIGCLEKVPVKTPNLDRLAEEGTLFTRSFVPVTFCSPTRAALATGKYPCQLGIDRNINERKDPLRLREPIRTFYHPLQEAGYRTHHLGKWHVGNLDELDCFTDADDAAKSGKLFNRRKREAGENAFDERRLGETEAIQDVFMTDTLVRCRELFLGKFSNQQVSIMGRHRVKAEYQYEHALADYCIDLIRNYSRNKEPFAITWSVSPPHPIYAAPSPYYDMYDPKDLPIPSSWKNRPQKHADSLSAKLGEIYGEEGLREFLRCYYAQVSMVDAEIGRIIDALKEEEILGNTLILFLSDHGNMNGHHGMIDKAAHVFYDDLIRVPTIIRYPGVFPAGRKEDRFITSMDFGPTILDCAGAKPLDGIAGKSVCPMFRENETIHAAVFNERGWLPPKAGTIFRTVRTEKWKLILESSGRKELYNMIDDPEELSDLADLPEHGKIVKELTDILLEHMERIDDPGRLKYEWNVLAQ